MLKGELFSRNNKWIRENRLAETRSGAKEQGRHRTLKKLSEEEEILG